jgi:hypothetical protein
VNPATRALRALIAAFALFAACSADAPPPAADAAFDAVEVPTVDVVAVDVTPDGAADAATADAGSDAAAPGGFGQPCAVGQPGECAEGLFCLQGPSGGRTGFCSRTCPRTSSAACAGAPPGTAAYCLVTNVNAAGDKGCAFVCLVGGMTRACPGELRCAAAEEPPGSGQRLCLP